MKMEFAVLNNGVRIPKLGFGVFQIPREECEESVRAAIDVGYRLIDTAQSYFNEAEVGKAVAESGVPREEFFITQRSGLTTMATKRQNSPLKHPCGS